MRPEMEEGQEHPATAPSAAPSRPTTWIWLAPIVLVLAPLLQQAFRTEIAEWRMALAYEAWLDRRIDDVAHHARAATAWDPEQIRNWLLLAGWLMDAGRYDQAIGVSDEALRSFRSRSHVEGDPTSDFQLAILLNLAAYSRALGQTELKRARELSEESLRRTPTADEGTLAAFLDTRGYISLLLRDLKTAKADMNNAIRLIEAASDFDMARVQRERQLAIDPRPFDRELSSDWRARIELYEHRAQLFEALGQPKKAQADRTRVRKLRAEAEGS